MPDLSRTEEARSVEHHDPKRRQDPNGEERHHDPFDHHPTLPCYHSSRALPPAWLANATGSSPLLLFVVARSVVPPASVPAGFARIDLTILQIRAACAELETSLCPPAKKGNHRPRSRVGLIELRQLAGPVDRRDPRAGYARGSHADGPGTVW